MKPVKVRENKHFLCRWHRQLELCVCCVRIGINFEEQNTDHTILKWEYAWLFPIFCVICAHVLSLYDYWWKAIPPTEVWESSGWPSVSIETWNSSNSPRVKFQVITERAVHITVFWYVTPRCLATSTQVVLGFHVTKSKCWDGSQDSKLPLHAFHVAVPT